MPRTILLIVVVVAIAIYMWLNRNEAKLLHLVDHQLKNCPHNKEIASWLNSNEFKVISGTECPEGTVQATFQHGEIVEKTGLVICEPAPPVVPSPEFLEKIKPCLDANGITLKFGQLG